MIHWGVLVLAVAAAVFLSAWITSVVVKKREEEQLGKYQDRILAMQREEVENIYRTMRGWRHDYHNHMQKIKAHLALGQIEDLTDYLNQLEEDLDAVDISVKTGNSGVDAILSSKVSLAVKKDIKVNCKATVPGQLQVKEIDLCVVIGNLIDNAMESCEKVGDREDKFIRIYIGIFKQQLYISVSNTTKESVRRKNREFLSGQRGNHGHGLRRIDNIVHKYDGYLNRKNEPGVFATEVMFPL